jgi:hypothetical protein
MTSHRNAARLGAMLRTHLGPRHERAVNPPSLFGSEDGSSIAVDVTDGNKRGREAAEAHEQAHPDEPMVFVVRDTTKVEIDDAPAALSEIVATGGEVRVQSKAPLGSDSFVARKVSVETDKD